VLGALASQNEIDQGSDWAVKIIETTRPVIDDAMAAIMGFLSEV
jgi:hypothetical protein